MMHAPLSDRPERPLELELPAGTELPPELTQTDLDADDDSDSEPDWQVSERDDGSIKIQSTGLISETKTKSLLRLFKGVAKTQVATQIQQHNLRKQASQSHSQQGIPFAPLPQLCLREQGELALLEPESFLYVNGAFSLLDFPAELPQFQIVETETTFAVDIDGNKVKYAKISEEKGAYQLNEVDGGFTENGLINELEREVHHPGVSPAELNRFLALLVGWLMKQKSYSLTALVRAKYPLARTIRCQIEAYRKQAASNGFQQLLFDAPQDTSLTLEASLDQGYEFKPGNYPARMPYYQGKFKFAKHYYPIIEDLKSAGEEFDCAQAIDSNARVKHWVRNLVKRQAASFRLPLASGYFYPDFVVELEDGRLMVVEYKGEAYVTNDDSREKNRVGQAWAANSGGKCLFLMAVESDAKGRNIYQQIANIIDSQATI